MIVQDYIYQAFRKCGQMRPGYTNNADLLADGLAEFQGMYDSWNAKRTMQYTNPDYVYPVTAAGHGSTGNNQTWGGTGYQIGPNSPDFNGPRPVAISRMNLLMTSASPTAPQRIPLTKMSMEEWTSIIIVQLLPINVTLAYAYDPQFPLGVIWIWPPLIGNSLEIYTWGQLTPPTALNQTFAVPPGYQDATVWTLAERLWPLCTHDIMPHKLTLPYIANKAKAARQQIIDINTPPPRMVCDFGGGRRSSGGVSDWDLLLTGRPY